MDGKLTSKRQFGQGRYHAAPKNRFVSLLDQRYNKIIQ